MEKVIKKFYFEMATYELNKMHSGLTYGNLTYNSLLYLDVIMSNPNCTVSYLADKLKVNKSAITVKVKELINQGLIIKTQSKEDKRVFYLTITEALKEEYKFCDKIIDKAITQAKNNFKKEDIDTFCKVLDYFSEYLRNE